MALAGKAMGSVGANTIGITATVPVEVLLAAAARPLDLNNAFLASAEPGVLVSEAEHRGFPLNCCAWIKGIYASVRRLGVGRVIGVAQWDCSNTHALMEVLESEGVEVVAFNYPYPKDASALGAALEDLAARLGTTREAAEAERERLLPLRRALAALDRLSWEENRLTGEENHRWLVGSSDFGGDAEAYLRGAEAARVEAAGRAPFRERHRVGFLGIPPICDGLYGLLESLGARVVFNEFQRQFSMPSAVAAAPSRDLVEQYLSYTYPYGTADRIADIAGAVRERRLDGLVHYVQSFCFRHIQDRLIRAAVGVPVLTLEFDRPGPLDGQSRTRLEAFVEMLEARRGRV